MSNSATFSYAQAAKGRSAAQPAGSQSSPSQSQAPSTTSNQNQDAPATSTRASSVAVSTTSNDVDAAQNTRRSSVKPDSSQLSHNEADTKSNGDEAVISSNTAESVSSSIQEAEKPLGEAVPQNAERRGRGQNPGPHASDASEARKGKKGKKGKASEKESDAEQNQDKQEIVPTKAELSEAPIPSVNPWALRREAHAAKAKTPTVPGPQSRTSSNVNSASLSGSSATVTADAKPRSLPVNGTDQNGVHNTSSSTVAKASKKDGDQPRNSGNQGTKRAAPRGARHEREDKPVFEALTALEKNTASWPTPETAAVETKVQTSAEKSDKDDGDAGPSKPRQKEKWVQVPIVPSVRWETPMPARSSRGGRTAGSRGGRDGAAGGGHSAGAANSTDRNQDIGAGSRAASAAKRGSNDQQVSRDSRKAQPQPEIPKSAGDPSLENPKAEASKQGQAISVNGAPNQHSSARLPSSSQRFDDGARSFEPQKDASSQGPKETMYHGQVNTNNRGSDRPRGGARGRGAHSNTNGMPSHQPQSPYGMPPGYFTPSGSARQASHPYGPAYPQMPFNGPFPGPPPSNYRGNRPGSINVGRGHAPNGARAMGHTGRVASMPPPNVHYDAGMYSPASGAFSYYDVSNHLFQLVQQQVEYYFSCDNLCKDVYLRSHMDSQGFVLMNVITSFKRMRELNVEWDLLRSACEESQIVELVIGEDGLERLRRREGWESWIMKSMEGRHPTARHDGPSSFHRYSRPSMPPFHPQMMPSPYAMDPQMFSPTGTDPNFVPYMNGGHMGQPMSNGVNGHHVRASESQLSAAVPEFSPGIHSGFAGAQATQTRDMEDMRSAQTNGAPSDVDKEIGPLTNGISHGADDVPHGAETSHAMTNGIGSGHGVEGH